MKTVCILERFIENFGCITSKGTCESTIGGLKNGAGHVCQLMDAAMSSSSCATVK